MKTRNLCFRSRFFEVFGNEVPPSDQKGTIGFDFTDASCHVDLLTDYRTQTDLLGILLAKAGFGVILITREGEFIYANDVAKALLSSRRGLCRMHDRISAVDIEANQKLQQLITGKSHRSGMLLRDKSSDESYAIRVVRILAKTDAVSPRSHPDSFES
jgi:signal transduction histidine kinase